MRYKATPLSVRGGSRPDRPDPPARPPGLPHPRPRRLRDWLATIPMVLLLPALLAIGERTDANSPSLVAPATVESGQTFTVTGTAFPAGMKVQLLWDGSAAGMPKARADSTGQFSVPAVVPRGSAGTHVLAAGDQTNVNRGGRQAAVMAEAIVASTSLQVLAPVLTVTPDPTATPVPTTALAPTPAPTAPPTLATPEPTAAPTASPALATPVPTGTPVASTAPVPTPTPSATPAPAPVPPTPTVTVSSGIWRSQAEIMALPASGSAWDRLVSRAQSTIPRDDLSCQDASAPATTMAAALVAARTNDNALRAKVRDELMRIIGTENGSACGHPDRNRPLGVGRNLAAYVIAADLIGFRTFDSSREATWRAWLSNLRSAPLAGGWALTSTTARADHSNWGAHQAAALTAANAYLGDTAALAVDAAWARAWVDVDAPRPWTYHVDKHDYSWSSTGIPPKVPVNPAGAVKSGVVVDGIPLVDMQRGGGFTTGKPTLTNYPRESLVGRSVQFELLQRAGYPAFSWGDRGLLRIAERLLAFSKQWESGWYEPRMNAYWILASRYGVALPRAESAVGRQVVGVDWTHR